MGWGWERVGKRLRGRSTAGRVVGGSGAEPRDWDGDAGKDAGTGFGGLGPVWGGSGTGLGGLGPGLGV